MLVIPYSFDYLIYTINSGGGHPAPLVPFLLPESLLLLLLLRLLRLPATNTTITIITTNTQIKNASPVSGILSHILRLQSQME